MHSFMRTLIRTLGVCVVVALAACGSTQLSPITAQHPIYLLLVKNQQMVLAVVNRPAYTLAGTLPITHVGTTPPSGSVGIAPDGSIIVTYTGAFLNGAETVTPATLICTLRQATCTSLVHGWGSATVDTFWQSLAVPLWQDSDPRHGQLLLLSGSPVNIAQRIPLATLLPGEMQIAPDGKSVYWLAPPGSQPGGVSYRLIRFDLTSRTMSATYDFGVAVPGGLAVAEDGTVYTSILYAKAGDSTLQTPPVPDNQILSFSPNLVPQNHWTVRSEPLGIAVSADVVAVTYQNDPGQHLDAYSRTSSRLLFSDTTSHAGMLDHLTVLSDGTFAVTVSDGTQTFLGLWSATNASIEWHAYAGVDISGVAG